MTQGVGLSNPRGRQKLDILWQLCYSGTMSTECVSGVVTYGPDGGAVVEEHPQGAATDHALLGRMVGAILWECPHCYHVNAQVVKWQAPWQRCLACNKVVRFGLMLVPESGGVPLAAPMPPKGTRRNRRLEPEGSEELFVQFSGYVVWVCEGCGRTVRAYPQMPSMMLKCPAHCGTVRYVRPLVWHSAPHTQRKVLPDDWIFPAADTLCEDRRNSHVRLRWSAQDRRRARPLSLRRLNWPVVLGRPRKGESRDAYLARLKAARAAKSVGTLAGSDAQATGGPGIDGAHGE